jgi:hypothetical protein
VAVLAMSAESADGGSGGAAEGIMAVISARLHALPRGAVVLTAASPEHAAF